MCAETGFKGELVCDLSKPGGTMRKLMDVSGPERLGWKASIPLDEGIRDTYAWFVKQGEAALRAS